MRKKSTLLLILLFTILALSCNDISSSTNIAKSDTTNTNKSDTTKTDTTTVAKAEPLKIIGLYAIADTAIIERKDNTAPVDFHWRDGDSIRQFSKEISGKVVLLNFWKTNCPSCVFEMPNLKQLASDYKDQNLVVVGENCNYKIDGVANTYDYVSKWTKDSALNYINFYSYILPVRYGIQFLPMTYVIDKNGKLVDSLMGEQTYEAFKATVDKYLQ